MKRIHIIILSVLFVGALYAHEGHGQNPVEGLTEISSGFTSNEDQYNTIHLYTATGSFTQAYNEVFIAVTNGQGDFVDDLITFNFSPLMDMGMGMGMMKHSTPIGKVEKVEGQPLYKTWFSFLMAGAWTLDLNYAIGTSGTVYSIQNIPLTVNAYTGGNKWLQLVSINGANYYLTLVAPTALTVGTQLIKAYLNKPGADTTKPYDLTDGSAYKIAIDPQMLEMEHGSSGNTDLVWKAEQEFFEGTVNLSMAGHWKIGLKVLSSINSAILADNNYFWQVDGVLNPTAAGISKQVIESAIRFYPTFAAGEVTVEVPVDAQIDVVGIGGQSLQSRTVTGGVPLTLNFSNIGKGLYLINIKTVNDEVIIRKVVVR